MNKIVIKKIHIPNSPFNRYPWKMFVEINGVYALVDAGLTYLTLKRVINQFREATPGHISDMRYRCLNVLLTKEELKRYATLR